MLIWYAVSVEINKYLSFEDYTSAELVEIFNHFCNQNDYCLTESATEKIRAFFQSAYASVSVEVLDEY
jgi:hypothetical protein